MATTGKGLPKSMGPKGPGAIVKAASYTVATAPTAASQGAGCVIFLSDGAAGSPCLAVSDGTNWLRCDTLATAAAT